MSYLLSRKSIVPQWLIAPGPDDEDLDYMLQAAVRAPDHGWIRPWRFIVIQGEAKEKMADLFEKALLARKPDATAEEIEKERGKPLRAPLLVTVAVKKTDDKPDIPMNERVLSGGAAAQNILLAAHEKGYGAMWVTGTPAYDPVIKAGLNLGEEDQIVGFIYIGTPDREGKERNRPDPAEYTIHWNG
ncbi:nitroreductase family protein [Kiloniella sp. b19]|uniref:nitroreductase family protein n=1 Tax=Kiloniella sp. GXU_MW_B19 TaxID=3141326 RepID=UPI0031D8FCD5